MKGSGCRLTVRWLLLAVLLAGGGRSRGDGARPLPEPAAPQPSAAVRPLLEAAQAAATRQQWAESLMGMERARAAARAAGDAAGEAKAERGRAVALNQLNRYADAASAWQAAAAAATRAGDGPAQVEALVVGALACVKSQQVDAARRLFAQALSAARAETRRPLAMATTLDSLAQGMEAIGHLAPARACWETAVALHERVAPDTVVEARVLSRLGAVVWRLGDPAQAGTHLRRALALQERLAPGSLDLADTLENLGRVAQRQRDWAGAERDFERALALRQKLAPSARETINALLNLGDLIYDRADLLLARHLFEQALGLEEQRAPDSAAVARILQRLGVVAYRQGDSAGARAQYQRALAIRGRLLPNPEAQADLLDNLGLVATQQDDLDAAAEYHQQALAIFEKISPDSLDMAFCLNNLGNVALRRGEVAIARGYYERALALKQKHAPDSLDVAGTLNNLGNLAKEQGDIAAAERYYRRSLSLREALAPESLPVANSLANLGAIERSRGHSDAALDDYRRAAAIEERLAPGSLSLADTLSSLARLAADRQDWPAAESLAQRAWGMVRGQAAGVTGDEAQQAFGASHASADAVLARIQLARGRTAAAFMTVEAGRGQALLRIVSERGLDTRDAPAALRAAYRAALAARDQANEAASEATSAEALARRALRAAQETRSASPEAARLRGSLEIAARQSAAARSASTRARIAADALWAQIKQHSPRAYLPSLTLPQAARSLPPGTLYLCYAVESQSPVLYLLRAGAHREPVLAAYPLSMTLAALQQRVEAFLEAVDDPQAGIEASTRTGRSLFTALVPAAARARVRTARRLLISPDGPLWRVPFATLVVNASGPPRYLGAGAAITLTQSLSLFVQARSRCPGAAAHRATGALVMGDPVFDAPVVRQASAPSGGSAAGNMRRLFWQIGRPPAPLPATAEEARQIARLYGTVPLLGAQATELALRRKIGTARVVHLATHAFFLPRQAMASGLLLSVSPREAAPGGENDGVLEAWEIYSQLRLQAELVVLSACDTGRGKSVPSEGIVGLTRALQYAGAGAVVASQWAVADTSTARLMVAFHRRLRHGLAKDEALRQAMALTRSDPRTAHPYYWAPFFLTGDPEPLSGSRMPPRRARHTVRVFSVSPSYSHPRRTSF